MQREYMLRRTLRKITVRNVLCVVFFILYVVICLGVFCMLAVSSIQNTSVLLYISRLRTGILLCVISLLLCYSVMLITARYKKYIQKVRVSWLEPFICKVKEQYYINKHADCFIQKSTFEYTRYCKVDGILKKVRNIHLFDKTYYEDTRAENFISSTFFGEMVCMCDVPSGFGKLSLQGGYVNAYKIVTTDTDNMLYVVRDVFGMPEYVDIYAFEVHDIKAVRKVLYCTHKLQSVKTLLQCLTAFLISLYVGLHILLYINLICALMLPLIILVISVVLKLLFETLCLCYKRVKYVCTYTLYDE